MFAGLLIGLVILAGAVALRAGMRGWISLVTAMVIFSHSPDQGLLALTGGVATWALLLQIQRRRRR